MPARVFFPLHILCVCALICGSVWYLPWSDIFDEQKSLFVFLGVFPLINGIFDWVSYGVTLSLLRHGQSTERPFVWGAVDVVVACLLFLGLGVTLVMVLHGLDQLAGGALIDLPALLGGLYALKDGNWSQSWALFMVFSTMVPTGLHLCMSLIGLQGLWGHGWRRTLAGWIEVEIPRPCLRRCCRWYWEWFGPRQLCWDALRCGRWRCGQSPCWGAFSRCISTC